MKKMYEKPHITAIHMERQPLMALSADVKASEIKSNGTVSSFDIDLTLDAEIGDVKSLSTSSGVGNTLYAPSNDVWDED